MKKPAIVLSLLSLLFVSGLFIPPANVTAQAASVTVAADQAAKSGNPGSSVVYTLTLTNPTAADENLAITNSSSGLVTISSPGSVTVPANGGTAQVQVAVNISPSAQPGNSDGTTVVFNSATASVSILLTTTVTAPPTVAPTQPAGRPLVVVDGYYLDQDTIRTGSTFNLFVALENTGGQNASNLILSFQNENFLPQDTGGVLALGRLDTGQRRELKQPFLVSSSLYGQAVAMLPVKLTYSDPSGATYTEAFAITLQLAVYTGPYLPTATPTLATLYRPQLVVSNYAASVNPLQPGMQFTLDLDVRNLGNSVARSATLVIGGGVTPDISGTPSPGGLPGGSGDLANFAPIGSSNLVFLGDIPPGGEAKASSNLIVNVTANPGAYTLKLSFVYTDLKGNRLVDDQIITLLVYQLPNIEVSYYRDPGMIFSGQPNTLPLQVVNLARKSTVLGNMTVSAAGAEVQNNISLVGPLDPGGSFTLDTTLIPPQAGDLEVKVDINYTDDFNQPRQLSQTIKVKVQEGGATGIDGGPINPEKGGVGPGGNSGQDIQPVVETLWDKVLRAVKGFLGLDSAPPQAASTPVPGQPSDSKVPAPVVVPPIKGP